MMSRHSKHDAARRAAVGQAEEDEQDGMDAMPEGKAVFVKANNVIYLNWQLEQALEDGLAAFVESRRRERPLRRRRHCGKRFERSAAWWRRHRLSPGSSMKE